MATSTPFDSSRIAALADETRGSILASLALVSFASIVERLVRNSISACAAGQPHRRAQSSVHGRSNERGAQGTIVALLDFHHWTVTVKDDGIGFPPHLDVLQSGRGTLAAKSTLSLLSYLGLVQIRSLSPAEAREEGGAGTCRARDGDTMRIIKDGAVLFEGASPSLADRATGEQGQLYSSTDVDSGGLGQLRLLNGTRGGSTVRIHDIFGKIPVRRKALRSLAVQKKQADRLKARIQELAMLHPDVAFRLHIRYAPPPSSALARDREESMMVADTVDEEKVVLSLPKALSIPDRFGAIYGSNLVRPRRLQAFGARCRFLPDSEGARRPRTAVACDDGPQAGALTYCQQRLVEAEIDGFYSTTAHKSTTGPAQHIFFNGEMLPGRSERRRAEASGDGLNDDLDRTRRYLSGEMDRFGLTDAAGLAIQQQQQQTEGGRPRTSYAASPTDAPHGRSSIHDVVASAVRRSLEQRGRHIEGSQVAFLVQIRARHISGIRPDGESTVPYQQRLSLDALVRMLEGSVLGEHPDPTDEQRQTSTSRHAQTPMTEEGTRVSKRLKVSHTVSTRYEAATAQPCDQQERPPPSILEPPSASPPGMTSWRDPITRRDYYIDTRTGTSYPVDYPRFAAQRPASAPSDSTRVKRRGEGCSRPSTADRTRLAKEIAAVGQQEEKPQWLLSTLEGWRNPAYGAGLDTERGVEEVPTLQRGGPFDRVRPASAAMAASREVTSRALRFEGDGKAEKEVEATPSPSSSPRKRSDRTESRFFAADAAAAADRDGARRSARRSGLNSFGSSASAVVAAALAEGRVKKRKSTMYAEMESAIPHGSLQQAEVVGQVDEKFIACLVSLSRLSLSTPGEEGGVEATEGGERRALVCIDQHAADERIRFERFLSEYVEGCSSGTVPSVGIKEGEEVYVHLETDMVETLQCRHRDVEGAVEAELRFWGFEGCVVKKARVEVRAIPEVWSERVMKHASGNVLEREEVREIVRIHVEMLAARPEEGRRKEGEEADWNEMARRMPEKVRHWIASKACRSAIMFNDPLDRKQCEALVERLVECRFPFMCAHGRPSIVPICLV